MIETMAGNRRRGGRTLCFVWCIVCAIIMEAVSADMHSNSSDSLPSTDGSGDLSSQTTMEKGMEPFFDMVKNFLGVVQPHKISEQTWLNLSAIYVNGHFQTEQFENWQNWATYLVGFCVCAAIGILFFIVMPVVGLVFCCCRCAGKCGGTQKQHDPKHAGCKRKTYCTLLLVLNTVALAGVVCAFLSNELLYQKLQNQDNAGPVGKLTAALNHIEGYINNTVDSVQNTILTDFNSSRTTITSEIRETANRAVDAVLINLNATALLAQAKELGTEVSITRSHLQNVADQLSLLSSNGSSLANILNEINQNVSSLCPRSTTQYNCGNYRPEDYAVSANFSHLDQLSSQADKVAQSLNMSKYIDQANQVIVDAKQNTTRSVNTAIVESSRSVDSVYTQIVGGINDVKRTVQTVTTSMHSTSQNIQDAQPEISKYSKYGWYGGLAVSCLLLLVVLLYYLGVLFGLCGERPGLGAQCCNTGTGANFLMAGVGFTFIFAWIMLVCLVLFVVGGPVYTEVCRYFDNRDPHELKPFETALLKASNLTKDLYNGKDVDISITDILDGCQKNKAVYSVMKLDNMVNLTQITDLGPLRKKLDELKNASLNIPRVQIVSQQLNETINNFANSNLDQVNFTEYYQEMQLVNKNLTKGDLVQMGNNLISIAVQSSQIPDNVKSELRNYGNRLKDLEETLVQNMRKAVVSLNRSLNYLDEHRTAIHPKVQALLNGLQTAENNFNNMKDTLVAEQLEAVVNSVLAQAQVKVNITLGKVRNDIGKCQAVYDGFYAATDAGCVVVLEPLNGFWFSVGWCLFFFIPILIFAVKLAGLYRREHDEKDFDDPNYILYGGSHQDTIPLTSRDRAYRSPYPGMANSAFRQDSYMGSGDKYAPPPYGASHTAATSNGSRGPQDSKQYYNY